MSQFQIVTYVLPICTLISHLSLEERISDSMQHRFECGQYCRSAKTLFQIRLNVGGNIVLFWVNRIISCAGEYVDTSLLYMLCLIYSNDNTLEFQCFSVA